MFYKTYNNTIIISRENYVKTYINLVHFPEIKKLHIKRQKEHNT